MSQSPAELIRLNNLQLAARIVSEELQGGIHLGQRIGTGTEFEQYRHYELQELTRQVHISPDLMQHINLLTRASRSQTSTVDFVKKYVEWGAGTRAGQALVLCAKARAIIKGRFAVIPEDINTLIFPIMRHRLTLHFKAEAENITADQVISEILKAVPLK